MWILAGIIIAILMLALAVFINYKIFYQDKVNVLMGEAIGLIHRRLDSVEGKKE